MPAVHSSQPPPSMWAQTLGIKAWEGIVLSQIEKVRNELTELRKEQENDFRNEESANKSAWWIQKTKVRVMEDANIRFF